MTYGLALNYDGVNVAYMETTVFVLKKGDVVKYLGVRYLVLEFEFEFDSEFDEGDEDYRADFTLVNIEVESLSGKTVFDRHNIRLNLN